MSNTKVCTPANGTDGDIFMAKYCDNCARHNRAMMRRGYIYCEILHDKISTIERPEWVQGGDIATGCISVPCAQSASCTAFEPRVAEGEKP